MPDTPSITIVKQFPYRGNDKEEFSNTYHFTGTTPANDAAWKTLADAIIAEERKLFAPFVKIVRVYGYVAGVEHAEAVIDYAAAPLTPVAGSYVEPSGARLAPGDAAYWVRWRTNERGSNGKWKYCRKYFHNVYQESAFPDKVQATQRTAALAYAAKMSDGSLPGGFKICTPQGAIGGPVAVSEFVTTRTLKRRGKRPSS